MWRGINSLLAAVLSSADNFSKHFGPDPASGLIWIRTVDILILKKVSKRQKIMKNYTACKELSFVFKKGYG